MPDLRLPARGRLPWTLLTLPPRGRARARAPPLQHDDRDGEGEGGESSAAWLATHALFRPARCLCVL